MRPWPLRGLSNGVVTSRWPRRSDPYFEQFLGRVEVYGWTAHPAAEAVCPTRAITVDADGARLDRGACVLCGACVRAFPETFGWAAGSETGRLYRSALVVPEDLTEDHDTRQVVRDELADRVRRLRRSVHLRHVDAGSDGSEEWEIQALAIPVYDVHRLGIFFTASPRHADILLVTGAGARGMIPPLRRTRAAMPDPVVVIAVGTDAISGGLWQDSYATVGGVGAIPDIDVDVWVPGSPPGPFAILHGILLALGRVGSAP
jgi:Ni,Fe-hydrogenase III small subunit/ferredoxin